MIATDTETARCAALNTPSATAQHRATAVVQVAAALRGTLLEQAEALYPDDVVDVFTLSPRGNFYGAFVRDSGHGRLVVIDDDDLDDVEVETLALNLRAFALVADDAQVKRLPSGYTQLDIRTA